MDLITGGSGFLGKKLAIAFGPNTLVLSRSTLDTHLSSSIKFDLKEGDKVHELIQVLRSYKIKRVFHAAAVTPWSNEVDFAADTQISFSISAICNELKIPFLYYFSGWNVYDMKGSAPFSEASPLLPVTLYGKSKLQQENYFKENLKSTQLVNLRLASIFGPDQVSPGLIPNLVDAAFKDRQLVLSSVATRRDYFYIGDLINVLFQLKDTKFEEKYLDLNVGSGESISVLEVAKAIQGVCKVEYGFDTELIIKDNIKESMPLDNQLSIQKAKKLGLIVKPILFTEGLSKYIASKQRGRHSE